MTFWLVRSWWSQSEARKPNRVLKVSLNRVKVSLNCVIKVSECWPFEAVGTDSPAQFGYLRVFPRVVL